jgi:catechol-2,3-dioxygenase
MGIVRMNHAVLYVRDADRTARFYADVLGFREVTRFPGGVFMQAPGSTNDHDIAFFTVGAGAGPSAAGRSTVGLYHLAWEVPTLADLRSLRERLASSGALVGQSDHGTTKSLYAHDPDGLEFEVCWIVPADRLAPDQAIGTSALDLETEIAHYGEATVGGR